MEKRNYLSLQHEQCAGKNSLDPEVAQLTALLLSAKFKKGLFSRTVTLKRQISHNILQRSELWLSHLHPLAVCDMFHLASCNFQED